MKKLLALLFLFLAAPAAAQEVVFFGWYSSAPFTCDGQTQYASYGDTTLVALQVCNGTSWKTLTTGSGTLNTVPKFTPDGVTLGNSTITDDGTVVTVNTVTKAYRAVVGGTNTFLSTTGTLPAVPSITPVGVYFDITSAGSAAVTQVSTTVALRAGYTGASATSAFLGNNTASGTDTGFDASSSIRGNAGVRGTSLVQAGTGAFIGTEGYARGAIAIGVFGRAPDSATSSVVNIGVLGDARNGLLNTGVMATLGAASSLGYATAALIADNAAVAAAPIALFRDNGTPVLTVGDSTTVTGATTIYGAAASDGTAGFLNVTGTLPAVPSTAPVGVLESITSAGSAAFPQLGHGILFNSGYTGTAGSAWIYLENRVAGTETAYSGGAGGAHGNNGIYSESKAITTGTNIGIQGRTSRSTGLNLGVFGRATASGIASINVGVQGFASDGLYNVGVLAGVVDGNAVAVSTPLLVDNTNYAIPVALFRDNGTPVLTVGDSTTVTGATTVYGAAASDGTAGFLNVTGTLPAVTTGEPNGAYVNITGAGSSSFAQTALRSWLRAGYTGSSLSTGVWAINQSAGTGTGTFGSAYGNTGIFAQTLSSTTGVNIGGTFIGSNSNATGIAVGLIAVGTSPDAGKSIGLIASTPSGGSGGGNTGAYIVLGNGVGVSPPDAGLVVDNANNTVPSAIFMDNGTPVLTVGDSTTVTGATTIYGAAASDGTAGFLNVTGTLPSAPSAAVFGSLNIFTSAGSAAFNQFGFAASLPAGYTGAGSTSGGYFYNSATGTGAGSATVAGGNTGVTGVGNGSSVTGVYAGVSGIGRNTTGSAFGVSGLSNSTGPIQVGMYGRASGGTLNVGGLFTIKTSTPTIGTSAALVADNGEIAAQIFLAQDNSTTVFSVEDVASVTGATSVYGAAASDGTAGFLNVTGTLPASPSAAVIGVRNSSTSAGSAAFSQTAEYISLNAGYTGSALTIGTTIVNLAAGTGVSDLDGMGGNFALNAASIGTTTGSNVGAYLRGYGSSTRSYGAIALGNGNGSSTGDVVGLLGYGNTAGATNTVGVAAFIRGGLFGPSYTTTALLADNMSTTAPIALFRDNGTTKVSIEDGGKLLLASGNYIEGTEAAAPAAPAAGQVILYAKSGAPGEFCSKDDGGTETCMSAGSGGSGISYAEAAAAVLAGF